MGIFNFWTVKKSLESWWRKKLPLSPWDSPCWDSPTGCQRGECAVGRRGISRCSVVRVGRAPKRSRNLVALYLGEEIDGWVVGLKYPLCLDSFHHLGNMTWPTRAGWAVPISHWLFMNWVQPFLDVLMIHGIPRRFPNLLYSDTPFKSECQKICRKEYQSYIKCQMWISIYPKRTKTN